jgi:hypothetical protein
MLVTGTFDSFIIREYQKYELKHSVLCNVPTNEDIAINGHITGLSEIALCPFLEIDWVGIKLLKILNKFCYY